MARKKISNCLCNTHLPVLQFLLPIIVDGLPWQTPPQPQQLHRGGGASSEDPSSSILR